ncbi:7080_t:CDS:2 [Entrophospora sp. SA101]|nr:7080_t:CDS:2 [Entrophospora sp. SA101]CAJ0823773.1 4709_t:CDS:2 [Entrophospora sp. SA101]CAJ0875998.1 2856_t:CDS:2 [Entrophospora sp. SA101]
MEIERVLNDVCGCLERLDLASIDSNNPIASGIVDIAEGVDKVVDELSEETKHILKEVELSKLDFSEKTGAIYQWRNCWSLRLLLGESEYSESTYAIHAVSRAIDPIFNYYKWNLKHAWYITLNAL